MGIYDSVMGAEQNAPGVGAAIPEGIAASSPVGDQLDIAAGLPQVSEQTYNELWGPKPDLFNQAKTTVDHFKLPDPTTSTDRGPAMHAEGGLRGKIVDMARSFQGTPYVWGGTSPQGFDCSGFVQYVYGKMGVNLPRVSYQQSNAAKRVGLGKLLPGDLVFWDNSTRNNGADHVAIYLGGGLIAEAPRPGVPLRIRRLDYRGYDAHAWGGRVL